MRWYYKCVFKLVSFFFLRKNWPWNGKARKGYYDAGMCIVNLGGSYKNPVLNLKKICMSVCVYYKTLWWWRAYKNCCKPTIFPALKKNHLLPLQKSTQEKCLFRVYTFSVFVGTASLPLLLCCWWCFLKLSKHSR